MEQPKTPAAASPQLFARARSFQHDALAEVFDRAFDDVFEFAHALSGDHATAEEITESAFTRWIDRLHDFEGDAAGATAMILALAEEAARRLPRARFAAHGVRESIARLPAAEHEAITLRLVAGLSPAQIATATARRPASVLGSEVAALRALRGASSGLSFALPAALRQLDAALDRLLDGAPAAEAAQLAPALSESGPLLAAAANLVSLPAQPAPPEVKARVRNHFLAATEARRAQWVHRHHTPAAVPGRRPRPRANPIGTGAALILAAILAVVAGAVLAFAADFSTPSSAIYPLKRLDERILLALTFDRVQHANLEVKLSEERVREAETEAATRHGSRAVQAMADRYDSLRVAAADLGGLRKHDTGWKRARESYLQQASQPVDPLERLLTTNGMKPDAAQIARLNERFQNDRKTLDRPLGSTSPTQPGAVPSGAPNTTPPPPTQ